jgi:hypothetical protein
MKTRCTDTTRKEADEADLKKSHGARIDASCARRIQVRRVPDHESGRRPRCASSPEVVVVGFTEIHSCAGGTKFFGAHTSRVSPVSAGGVMHVPVIERSWIVTLHASAAALPAHAVNASVGGP